MSANDKTLNKVKKLINRGRFSKALPLLEHYLKSNPNSAYAWSELSRCYLFAGNFIKAKEIANRALEKGPELKSVLNLLFLICDLMGDFDEEMELIRKFVQAGNIKELKKLQLISLFKATGSDLRYLNKKTKGLADPNNTPSIDLKINPRDLHNLESLYREVSLTPEGVKRAMDVYTLSLLKYVDPTDYIKFYFLTFFRLSHIANSGKRSDLEKIVKDWKNQGKSID